MAEQRYRGFVMGRDTNQEGRPVWKVRVNDPESDLNHLKLVVASVHGELMLARGLNVHFAIGTVNDRSGQEALRAVDVQLQEPSTKSLFGNDFGQKVRRTQ